MDRALDPKTGDYNGKNITSLENAIYIRLTTPLGSWWADPSLGSQLHLIAREKDVQRVGALAKQYAEEALAPLLSDGRAKSIEITHTQPSNGWLILHIVAVDGQGKKLRFEHPVTVI